MGTLRVPEFKQPTVDPKALPNVPQNVNYTGAGYGEQVAGAVGHLGGVLSAWAQKTAEEDGRLWALQQASELGITSHQNELKRRQEGPADAKDHTLIMQTAYQGDVDLRLKNAPNAHAQKYFQSYAASMQDDVVKRAFAFETEAHERYKLTAFENTLEQHKQRMVDTPDMFEKSLGYIMEQAQTLSEADRQKIQPKAIRELAVSAVQSQIIRDPDAATSVLRGLSGASVAGTIVRAAQTAGIDPTIALSIASLESNVGANAGKNGKSSAHGVFQILDGTWTHLGGKPEERNDSGKNIEYGIKYLKENHETLVKGLGRIPEPWELYLAHQKGAGGALAMLRNPEGNAVVTLGRDAVINNGGTETDTNAQHAEMWKRKYAAHEAQVSEKYAGVMSGGAPAISDPVISKAWPNLDAGQRLSVMKQAESAAKQKQADTRVFLDQLTADASAAYMNGDTPPQEPTEAQMLYAHGQEQGAIAWQNFQDTKSLGQTVSEFKTMPIKEILEQHEARRPMPGEGYAHKVKLHDMEAQAIQQLVKAREADPMTAVMTAHPRLKETLENAKAEDMPQYLGLSWSAQDMLGIPDEKKALLTKPIAADAVKRAKDDTLSQDERLGAITTLMSGAQDPAHRKAIWRQLEREGLPEMLDMAFFVGETNTPAAFHRMAALALTPGAGALVQGDTNNAAIRDSVYTMFNPNNVGGALFPAIGSEGIKIRKSAENAASRLMNFRLSQNGGNVQEAQAFAEETLWGNSRQIKRGDRVNIVLSKDDDAGKDDGLVRGLNLMRNGIQETLTQQLEALLPPTDTRGGSAERYVIQENGKRFYRDLIERSTWINHGGGFALWDPITEGIVVGSDNRPLIIQENNARDAGRDGGTLAPGWHVPALLP